MSNSILSINSTYWRIALLFFCLSLELHAQKIQMKDIPHIDKLPVNAINTIFKIPRAISGMVRKKACAVTMDTTSAYSAQISRILM